MTTAMQARQGQGNISAYSYPVSEPAAIIFAVLFGISTLISIFQLFKYRAWIWFVMILAMAAESAGYAVRVVSARDPTAKDPFAASFTMIVLAPVLMAGNIYVLFGRIVFYLVPRRDRTFRLLWAPARWLTLIFVAFDIFALLLQLAGALALTRADPLSSDFKKQVDLGRIIAVIGVIIQLGAFGVFTIIAARFHSVSRRFGGPPEPLADGAQVNKPSLLQSTRSRLQNSWKSELWAVNLSCLFILVRSIYRLIEFIEGRDGYLLNHEWPLYVLDAVPMLAVCIVYNFAPPGRWAQMGFRQTESRRGEDMQMR